MVKNHITALEYLNSPYRCRTCCALQRHHISHVQFLLAAGATALSVLAWGTSLALSRGAKAEPAGSRCKMSTLGSVIVVGHGVVEALRYAVMQATAPPHGTANAHRGAIVVDSRGGNAMLALATLWNAAAVVAYIYDPLRGGRGSGRCVTSYRHHVNDDDDKAGELDDDAALEDSFEAPCVLTSVDAVTAFKAACLDAGGAESRCDFTSPELWIYCLVLLFCGLLVNAVIVASTVRVCGLVGTIRGHSTTAPLLPEGADGIGPNSWTGAGGVGDDLKSFDYRAARSQYEASLLPRGGGGGRGGERRSTLHHPNARRTAWSSGSLSSLWSAAPHFSFARSAAVVDRADLSESSASLPVAESSYRPMPVGAAGVDRLGPSPVTSSDSRSYPNVGASVGTIMISSGASGQVPEPEPEPGRPEQGGPGPSEAGPSGPPGVSRGQLKLGGGVSTEESEKGVPEPRSAQYADI